MSQVYMMTSSQQAGQYMPGSQYYPQQGQLPGNMTSVPSNGATVASVPGNGGNVAGSVRFMYPSYQQPMEGQHPVPQHPPMSVAQATPQAQPAPQFNGAYMWGQQTGGTYPPTAVPYHSQPMENFSQTYQNPSYNYPQMAGGGGDYQYPVSSGAPASYSQPGGFYSTPSSQMGYTPQTASGGYQARSPPIQIPPQGVQASGQYYYPGGGAGSTQANPRPPGVMTFPNSAVVPTQSPPQGYPSFRPSMQMSMQIQTRTTPPPNQGVAAYSGPLVPGHQVKVIQTYDRKQCDTYTPSTEPSPGKAFHSESNLNSQQTCNSNENGCAINSTQLVNDLPFAICSLL